METISEPFVIVRINSNGKGSDDDMSTIPDIFLNNGVRMPILGLGK